MNKKLTTIVLASTLGLGALGALGATAIPAMADTTSPSPSASSSSGTSGSSSGSTSTTDAARQAELQQRIADDLAGLVSDGTITQEQADAVAETLAAAMPAGGPGGHRGPGGHGGGFGGLTAAATAIGITEDELRTQLEAGKSIAQVAEAEGVSEQAVIDAMVKAAEDHFAEEVASGEHTQAEVDAKLADLEARITTLVETEGLPQRGGPDAPAPSSTSSGTATPSTSATSAA